MAYPTKTRYLHGALLIVSLLLMSIAGFLMYQVANRIRGIRTTYVTPLRKDAIISPQVLGLEHYYEYRPLTNIVESASFIPSETVTYSINSDGISSLKDYPINKAPNVFRIVTVGDSFTNGDWVNTYDNYPSQLERMLNKQLNCNDTRTYEVINIGVGGYDLEYEVMHYKLHGQKYKPDLVLWFMFENDFIDLFDIRHSLVRDYLASISAQIDLGAEKKATASSKPVWGDEEYRKAWEHANIRLDEEFGLEKISEMEYASLLAFNDLYSGPIVVFTDSDTAKKYKELMKKYIATRSDGYFFDRLPNYQRYPDGHPTAKGYTQIVGSLYKFLIQNNLISCSIK